jgi:3-oxoacyl-(acyl-carrier-protein) synthase/thioesterase domain-containing protein
LQPAFLCIEGAGREERNESKTRAADRGGDLVEASAIAVIGMAGRFPGAADTGAFWKNLIAGVEAIHRFTEDELRAARVGEEVIADPSYVKACGRLEGIEMFDASFFGMSPRDAAIFDPQHRIFLECAWEAMENAGYVGEAMAGPVGVFATCGMSEYMIKNVMTNPEIMAEVGAWLVRHTGNDTNFLATRVSYELNLRGPSVNVQTACSSALVAVHLACQSLLNGECDLALVGGATVYPEQDRGYFWREGEILSPDGRTRSFDASAAGTIFSSASACVVLKRLADALRDGDTVLAVVRGSAVNNDGHDKVGYLAPSVSGQARAIREAIEIAGVSSEEVSYVEAHGTATRIGDPIEIAALTQAYRASTDKKGYCAVGSLKSSIGHTGEASGGAAFVKAVLALQHRLIPPSLNYESPNPQCDFPSSPFFVNTKLRPWDAARRICGVTSLGAGGTNCHVVLEEAPEPPPPAPSRSRELLVVSARTPAALEAAAQNLARHLEENTASSLADAAFTLAVGRKAFRHRCAVVAKDTREAARALASKEARDAVTGEATESVQIALFFPGSGGRLLGAAGELSSEPAFVEAMEACLACLRPRVEEALLMPGAGTLPALFAAEYAVGRLLLSWGVVPAIVAGEGAGEYVAACFAGILSLEDTSVLIAECSRWTEPPSPGELERFAQLCRTVRLDEPRIRVASSRTGGWVTNAQATDPQFWSDPPPGACPKGAAVTRPGAARFEPDVAGLLREAIPALPPAGDPRTDLEFFLAAVGRLWTAGGIELGGLYEGQARRRVPLPTYPWQRSRYWIAPGQVQAPGVRPGAAASPAFERPDVSASFVTPRSLIEQEFAAMWRELLGVERVGVCDDFFELGGQSLVAVRFFARVRKKFGIDLPLVTLLEAPTIEKLAAIVAAAAGPAAGAPSEVAASEQLDVEGSAPVRAFRSLVPIQAGVGGRALFCVHGAGGNVLNFRDLSRALRADQPVYGLQARGIDGVLRPHAIIEEMAAAYLEEVRAHQPRGPYMLAGYSGGGLVALEMAQRLSEVGEAVNLLALIDTFHPATPIRKMTLARRLERTREEGAEYLRHVLEHQAAQYRVRRKLKEALRLAATGQAIPAELREVYLVFNFQEAVARYRPRPWGGRAILFRADRLDYILRDASFAYGWEGILTNLEISRVPGDHASLLLVPHASVLVEALSRAVDGVDPSDGGSASRSTAARATARGAPAVAHARSWLDWLRTTATGVLTSVDGFSIGAPRGRPARSTAPSSKRVSSTS